NRNDVYDANAYFLNQQGIDRQPLRFNQYGGTFGGPILKDKLFFFLSYQGNHFRESSPPTNVTVESSQWRDAGLAALANSTAALLYKNFKPVVPGTLATNLNDYAGGDFSFWLCPDNVGALAAGRIAKVIGVTAQDQANMAGCSAVPGLQAGSFDRSLPFENKTVAFNGSQNQ